MAKAFQILHYSKYLALILVVIGIPIIVMDKSYGAQIPLLIGLFMANSIFYGRLFISRFQN